MWVDTARPSPTSELTFCLLGEQVVDSFLEAGWKVKGTVRNKAKADHLLARYPTHADRLEMVQVPDIVTGKGMAEAMAGCDAVAHTASPYALTFTDPIKDFIDPAVKGTLSVLQAASDAGIRRVVVTSSFAAVTNFAKGGPVSFPVRPSCRSRIVF